MRKKEIERVKERIRGNKRRARDRREEKKVRSYHGRLNINIMEIER